MDKFLKTTFTAIAVLAAVPMVSASNLGYCTDNINRNNIFRMGATEKQGLAIRLDSEKLHALKGCTISSISAAFGSSRTTDGNANLFIATDLAGTPLVSQTSKISGAVKWIDFPLNKTYTITGNEGELFIGYTAEISVKSLMLMGDFSTDAADLCYAFNDGKWVDINGLGYGNALIRVGIDNAPSLTDVMIKPVSTKGYFQCDTPYSMKGQLFNFGTETIKSLDIAVSVNGGTPVVLSHKDLNLKQNTTFDFDLPEFKSSHEGLMPIKIDVTNINGTVDATPADNIFDSPLFFYPRNMERSILLEGFTGQDCSNCPGGHKTLHNFLSSGLETPVIEVMHHAGYQPDQFTMDADLDYTYFYGSPSTFAPAIMVNRSVYSTIGTVPVLNVSTSILSNAYNAALNSEPYASLALETTFNPATAEVTVALSTQTHNDIPAEDVIINVMLVQDNLIGRQVPAGDGYVHNGVFRGVLTGNSWGVLLDKEATKAGGSAKWATTFTLPEYIFSDYWGMYNLPDDQKLLLSTKSIPEDMRIVAFIASFDQTDVAGHTVYNAVEAPLGKSHIQGGFVGVQNVLPDNAAALPIRVVNGQVVVDGDYDSLTVTSIDGRSMNPKSTLTSGIYVVRATSGKNATVKKVLVK